MLLLRHSQSFTIDSSHGGGAALAAHRLPVDGISARCISSCDRLIIELFVLRMASAENEASALLRLQRIDAQNPIVGAHVRAFRTFPIAPKGLRVPRLLGARPGPS